MLNALEILLIVMVVGGLVLLQIRTQTGSMFPYLTVVVLLLTLIVAARVIRSIFSLLVVLALLCGVLLWGAIRPK